MDTKHSGSADAFGRIHFREVRVINIGDTQRTHDLASAIGACGFGGILQNLTDAGRAGEHAGSLADGAIDAKQLGNKREAIDGRQLLFNRQIVERDCQRNGAGSHIGERIHYHVIHSQNQGITIDECFGCAEYKIACHKRTAGGSHIPHIGELSGGVAGDRKSTRLEARTFTAPAESIVA